MMEIYRLLFDEKLDHRTNRFPSFLTPDGDHRTNRFPSFLTPDERLLLFLFLSSSFLKEIVEKIDFLLLPLKIPFNRYLCSCFIFVFIPLSNWINEYASGRNSEFEKEFYVDIRREIHRTTNFSPFEDKGGYPIMIFPKLQSPWTVGRPPKEFKGKYMKLVEQAIDFLNEKEVSHEDLRPENIFFQIKDGELFLKVIDFEDSLSFGSKIRKGYLYENDVFQRYPIFSEEDYYAERRHNLWFREAIRLWLEVEENVKEGREFSYFMLNNYQLGVRKIEESEDMIAFVCLMRNTEINQSG